MCVLAWFGTPVSSVKLSTPERKYLMASERNLHAKEKRRPGLSRTGESVDYPFLLLVLLLLTVGLAMLYSASYAQSEYDTSYEISTKYLQKQAVCAAIVLPPCSFSAGYPRASGTGSHGRCTA